MPLVKLTKGYFASVSDEDADLCNLRWVAQENRKGVRVYPVRHRNEATEVGMKVVADYMHRLIAARMGLQMQGRHVDHIDGDTLNNQRSNLRSVPVRENIRNQPGGNARNTSGHLGVHWHARNNRWHATIRNGAGKIHLGCFLTKEEAVAARLAGERRLWGIQPRRQEAHAQAA